jgi:hypothetical protein
MEKQIMEKQIKYFLCRVDELERINEGLQNRNIDADSVISITNSGDCVIVWYKEVKN